jgi:CBS-domain-containing membrane protein
MSPRAAWRLEDLDFPDVAYYPGGIADWMASGLPIEGNMAADLYVAAVALADVPTCGPREPIGAIRERIRGSGWDTCMVVNQRRVLLGRLHADDLDRADADQTAEDAMRPGPVTYRPDFRADQLLDTLEQRDLTTAPVTTSEGVLIGLVRRSDLERAILRAKGHRHRAA